MEGLGNFITSPSFYKNIKNMIRATDIQEKMLSLVGWEQNYDTSDFCIAEHLTKSESGLYFQGVHPLLTLQNLSCIAPDFKNIEYPAYDNKKLYKKGNIVSYNGVLYKALQSAVGLQPDVEPLHWTDTNPFSEWLEFKTKASIQKAIFRFCNEKLAAGTHKILCENRTLFDTTSRIADVVKNKSNLVGFEIIPIRSKGIVTKINKIGLHFTEPGNYTLYLMQSGSDLPVRKLQVTKTKKNTAEWFSFDDLYLPYESADTEVGGSWYLCYLQGELPENSQAIRKDKDWSKAPCSSCSRKDSMAWQAWSKYLEIHPFYVNSEFIEKEGLEMPEPEMPEPEIPESEMPAIRMWDVEHNQYNYSSNYGLNLEVTVQCDITDILIEQRHIFQDVIAKQVAVDMLREFAYNANVRTNRHSINAARTDILYELDGDSSSLKNSGLNYQLDMAFKAIKFDTNGISRICLPCKNNGLKFRTI
jgi:hypothetical protein